SRLSQKIQLMLDWVDLMDSRENFGKLARHYRASAGVIGVAEQSARNRLTLDQSHHKEGGTEHGFVFRKPEHLRDRNTFFERRAQDHEFMAAIGIDPMLAGVASQYHGPLQNGSVLLRGRIE